MAEHVYWHLLRVQLTLSYPCTILQDEPDTQVLHMLGQATRASKDSKTETREQRFIKI